MDEIKTLLTRGVSDVVVREEMESLLRSGKKLRIKLGIDPTGSDLTLGHAVVMRKLAAFQNLGHQIIFLFGGFTATIGDPTGRNQTRPILTREQVENNAQSYLAQAGKFLDISACEVRNNADWLEKMSATEIFTLLSKKSAQQILARHDFRDRFEREIDIHLQEFLYPLLQGYDSVVLDCDVEIGGNDQLFNLLVGRDLQKKYGRKTGQNVLTTSLLVGTDGREKMSKSLGNFVGISDDPAEKFGKIMSISDSVLPDYFEMLTDEPTENFEQKINENPRDAKVFLAKTIITQIDGAAAADAAEKDFVQKFVDKTVPENIPNFSVPAGEVGILDLLSKHTKFADSNSEARRLVLGSAVSIDDQKITDPQKMVSLSGGEILKVGKRKFGKMDTGF